MSRSRGRCRLASPALGGEVVDCWLSSPALGGEEDAHARGFSGPVPGKQEDVRGLTSPVLGKKR